MHWYNLSWPLVSLHVLSWLYSPTCSLFLLCDAYLLGLFVCLFALVLIQFNNVSREQGMALALGVALHALIPLPLMDQALIIIITLISHTHPSVMQLTLVNSADWCRQSTQLNSRGSELTASALFMCRECSLFCFCYHHVSGNEWMGWVCVSLLINACVCVCVCVMHVCVMVCVCVCDVCMCVSDGVCVCVCECVCVMCVCVCGVCVWSVCDVCVWWCVCVCVCMCVCVWCVSWCVCDGVSVCECRCVKCLSSVSGRCVCDVDQQQCVSVSRR